MCQGCHNRYDAEHRRAGIKARALEAMREMGQTELLEEEENNNG
jgi:hypothetical protein